MDFIHSSQKRSWLTVGIKVSILGEPETNKWEAYLKIEIERTKHENENSFVFYLTDMDNSLFWFSCIVKEDQFDKMKKEQDLIVDFDGFPNQVSQILNLCVETDKENRSQRSKYFCTFVIQKGHSTIGIFDALDASDDEIPHVDEENGIRRFIPKYASLQVFERGSFKNLLHLQLDFYELDDLSIKKSLSSKIILLQREIENLTDVISGQASKITELERKLDGQAEELHNQNAKKKEETMKLNAVIEKLK